MQEYRFKFYLNAMHSIQIENTTGQIHPHTWEIAVDVLKQNNEFITFTEVEKMVEELLLPFQDKNMNEIPPFDAVNPTLENVSIYMQQKLEYLFIQNGFILLRLEVSETPARSFIIDIKNEALERPERLQINTSSKIVENEAEELIRQKAKDMAAVEESAPSEKDGKDVPKKSFFKKAFHFFKKS